MEKKKISRGIRNNNPGNIRNVEGNKWKGEVGKQDKKDSSFEEFATMTDGIRALMILLTNYQKKYQLRSVRGLIGKYAPNNENDTSGYIASVCRSINCKADDELNLEDKDTMFSLVKAICLVETGVHVDTGDLNDAWDMM